MQRLELHQRVINAALAARLCGLSDAHHAALVEELTRAKAELDADDASGPELTLRDRLELSTSELAVLVFLAAAAESYETAELVTRCAPNGLTTEAIRKLVFGGGGNVRAFHELRPSGRLRKLALIVRGDGHAADLHENRQTWTVSDRVLAWLYGDESIDASVSELSRPSIPPRGELLLAPETIAQALEAMRAPASVVVIHGKPGHGRRSLVAHAAANTNARVLEIDTKRLSSQRDELVRELGILVRECRLLSYVPLLLNIDELDAERIGLVGRELVAGLGTSVFVTCGLQRPRLRWDRPVIAIEVLPPTGAQRAKLWRDLLPEASEEDAAYLSNQYPLSPALTHHAAAAVAARAVGRAITPEDFTHGIRAVLDDRLGTFATRVDVTQTWDDLVIEEDQTQAIGELIARIRQRSMVYEQWGFAAKVGKGLGTAALFSGPPGTGKSMAAALIAKTLGLELYQVDMAKITSKFIGETEKHLGEMFDAAEAGHAILLFDEADSLFGKRTEVRSSNDRYANLETNYLLQRMESFTGICLLTSNHESNIDPAFQRRLSLHLRFQVPGADERERLWRSMLPALAPMDSNLDFASLARRFEMTGGYIRNAALRAAFLAAEEGCPIGQAHLEHSARVE